MRVNLKRVLCIFFTLLFLFTNVLPLAVGAVGFENPMEHTYVIDDLQTKNFVLSAYPKDQSASFVSLIEVDEYGYDYGGDMRYYGIYLYVYNPTGRAINPDNCTVQMSYKTSGGKLAQYRKYPLEIMSVSEDTPYGDYDGLFYKFKVSSTGDMSKQVLRELREYYFSGIELDYGDGLKDFPLEHYHSFTGYQENFGIHEGDADTLTENVDEIEVARIEIHPASWLSDTSILGKDYRWELSSVYFNIPDHFINKYGNVNDPVGTSGLRAVRGVYTKALVNGVLIQDQATYQEFVDTVSYYNLHCSSAYDPDTSAMGGLGFADIEYFGYNLSFNMVLKELLDSTWDNEEYYYVNSNNVIVQCYYPMYSPNLYLSQDAFLKEFQKSGIYFLSSDTLVNAGLEGFDNLGYQAYEVTTDQGSWNDAFKTYASANKYRWFNKWINKELYTDKDGYGIDCSPIVELSYQSLIGTDSYLSNQLYLMEDQVAGLKDFYTSKNAGNHVYLMRFDCTPYYGPEVGIYQGEQIRYTDSDSKSDAIYFEKVIYEDFDILEFEFENKESKREIVAVVCDPIDIVGAVVPGNNGVDNDPNKPGIQGGGDDGDDGGFDLGDILRTLLIGALIVGGILLILHLLGVPIKPILKGIGWLIALPFRLLAWVIKALGKLFGIGRDVAEEREKVKERKRKAERHEWDREKHDRDFPKNLNDSDKKEDS